MKLKVTPDGYGATPQAVDYWTKTRTKISDLYLSEKHFLTETLIQSKSVLDIGCAVGGSAFFTREINPEIAYTGVDISAPMIQKASSFCKELKNTNFLHFDGHHIPRPDKSVDFCFSLGVFHHVPNWTALAEEALRISQKYVLFDLRIWDQDSLLNSEHSYQKLAQGQDWDGVSVIPYNIVSFNDLFLFLNQLSSRDISSKLFGYYGKPTELAVTPAKKVLMASILLEKNSKNANLHVEIL